MELRSADGGSLAWLPLAHLNLRYNPFGELTRQQRAAAAVVETDELVPWIQAAEPHAPSPSAAEARRSTKACSMRALQFMGDCGRGKTTHLLTLQTQLPDSAYVYLAADAPTPAIPVGVPLLIDEAQRLPWLVRRRVLRRRVPLILGTHVDLAGPLERAGYRVRTIDVSEHLDARRLVEILNRRIELARLRPGELPRISQQDAERLIGRFGNNIRAIESYLYDQLHILTRTKHGKVRFVD
ncbi:hypothetical protein [Candidatus Laterigemmans baculatus]|uniref:hypothetical protein n=1 Tax=Candidatus Laterigemmans baculatus TaxID=2770505 RepID=UPI00193B6046|nr:hypothetical protein [Candidatus Laterigemmans baculatus]